jgi:hypothetical protein
MSAYAPTPVSPRSSSLPFQADKKRRWSYAFNPAFIDIELIATANGIGIVQNSLLGGVVPASDLAVNLDVSGQQINRLR